MAFNHDLLGRTFGLANIDLLGTLFIAAFLVWYFKLQVVKTVILTFIIGELTHVLFDIQTPITKFFK